jgi:hypothetical protein
MLKYITCCLFCLITVPGLYGQLSGPRPGDVYREFILNLKTGDNWRVTDPDALASGALDFLPNPVMTIRINDLDGAIRAEALMDIWGGHTGTTGKKFRFNGNAWIDIPDHPTIPVSPECYNSEFNYITEVPLGHLQEGANGFEGTSGGQTCFNFNWGQWGWYMMLIRIYYGPEKPHPTGSITSHPSGSDVIELDTILVEAQSPAGVKRVDLLGRYRGYDENGDGLYQDWHSSYHTTTMEEHIGSTKTAPYTFVWDNRWVPDQEPEAVSFLARILDSNDVWMVAGLADSISLVRPQGVSVKMFTAENVPQKFWVRAGEKKSCDINIDDLAYATNAMLVHRTWNGQEGDASSGSILLPLFVNSWRGKVGGANHNYALSRRKIPVDILTAGNNEVAYHSNTVHHGIEILWPGPAILVRYNVHAPRVETPVIDPVPGEYEMPLEVSISCGTPGAEIYYTTAGSDPDVGSRKYANPFNISDSAIVKAIATKFDYRPSETAEHRYNPYLFPRLMEAYKGENEGTVEVEFNKPVDKASAEDTANYCLDNDGIIRSARLDTDDPALVILSVGGMVDGEKYTLSAENVMDGTGIPIPFNSSATFVYAYIMRITASDADGENIALNTVDGNLTTYWSANGTSGVWIQYDLRTLRLVQSVDMAFYLGDQRKSYFIIQTSVDGENWTEVYNGESSGNSLELEKFNFEDTAARYVRILGLGNSSTSNWNSYTEVQINWFLETQITDFSDDEALSIYPVPAVQGMHILFPSWKKETDIFLVDALGRKSHGILTDQLTWITTSNLSSGMYVVIIPMPDRILTKRIIVLND